MTKDKGSWKDDALRRLAKKQVPLPVVVIELAHSQLLRRLRNFSLIFAGATFTVFAILFAAMGMLPGFVDREKFTDFDDNAEWTFAAFLFGLPLLCGLLLLWFGGMRVRRRADEENHPWRFSVTADGMEVTSAQNRTLAGPWSNWFYRGYNYITVKGSRIPISLHVACQDTEIAIEFSRFRRREATQLFRGVLQCLAAAGHTDQ